MRGDSDSDPKTTYTDGAFRIATDRVISTRSTPRNAHHFIQHYCESLTSPHKCWWYFGSHPSTRNNLCSVCQTAPPAGLQAVFWFLKQNEYEG